MDAITSIIPVPRPVPIEQLGIVVQVAEFTLRDLATLQSMLDGLTPDPLLEIGPALAETEGEARRQLLVAAWERVESTPVYGEVSGREWFATAEGVAALGWVALRRYQPELTPAQAAALILQMRPWEFSALWRIAHGQDSRQAIERMIWSPPASGSPGQSRLSTWGQVIEEVIQAHPGWTNPDVYDLTLTELSNARRGGKPRESGVAAPANRDPFEVLAEMRRAYGWSEEEIQAGRRLPKPAAQDARSGNEGRPGDPVAE